MRPTCLALLAVLAAVPAAASPAQRATFTAELTGAAAGDPDGSGRAQVVIDTGRLRLCYVLTASGIAPASGAQIHRASANGAGGPLVRLLAPRDGESRACVEVSEYDAHELLRRPESLLVSVRNAEYPAGALSGPLQR